MPYLIAETKNSSTSWIEAVGVNDRTCAQESKQSCRSLPTSISITLSSIFSQPLLSIVPIAAVCKDVGTWRGEGEEGGRGSELWWLGGERKLQHLALILFLFQTSAIPNHKKVT